MPQKNDRPYDENWCATCPSCQGDMEAIFDEKTCANERVCKECGYTITDGFGVL